MSIHTNLHFLLLKIAHIQKLEESAHLENGMTERLDRRLETGIRADTYCLSNGIRFDGGGRV